MVNKGLSNLQGIHYIYNLPKRDFEDLKIIQASEILTPSNKLNSYIKSKRALQPGFQCFTRTIKNANNKNNCVIY
jgi:hypothetical protein